jgi:hypothetical protein
MPMFQSNARLSDIPEYKPFNLAEAVMKSMKAADEITLRQQEIQRSQVDLTLERELAPVKVMKAKIEMDRLKQEKDMFDIEHAPDRMRLMLDLDAQEKQAKLDEIRQKTSTMKSDSDRKNRYNQYLDELNNLHIARVDLEMNGPEKEEEPILDPMDIQDLSRTYAKDIVPKYQQKLKDRKIPYRETIGLRHTLEATRMKLEAETDPIKQEEYQNKIVGLLEKEFSALRTAPKTIKEKAIIEHKAKATQIESEMARVSNAMALLLAKSRFDIAGGSEESYQYDANGKRTGMTRTPLSSGRSAAIVNGVMMRFPDGRQKQVPPALIDAAVSAGATQM